jgi:hypothetical protein
MSHGQEAPRALPAAHQLVVGLVSAGASSDASRLRLRGEPQDVNECPFLYDSYAVRVGAISWNFEPWKLGFTQYVVGTRRAGWCAACCCASCEEQGG